MLKKTNVLLVCLFLSFTGYAQMKNTVTLSSKLIYANPDLSNRQSNYQPSLQSRIGFFPVNNFSVGLCLENGLSADQTVPFGLTFYGRMYTGKAEHKTVKFFAEAGFGVAHHVEPVIGTENIPVDNHSLNATAYVSPGINIFIGNVFSFELAPEYRYIAGVDPVHRLGGSAGITLFLSEKIFKKVAPNEFTKLY